MAVGIMYVLFKSTHGFPERRNMIVIFQNVNNKKI
jgi:hypothetical protein